jgi:hypothetical protein
MRTLVALTAMLVSNAGATTITYLVTADTSSVVLQSGYLDLQFEPNPSGSNPATAVVSGFTTGGVLTGAAFLTGDATGQLPAPVNFDNQTTFNDYFQPMSFGSSLSFDVTLDGPNPIGGSSSAFNIAFYAADGSTPILTTSPDGIAGQIVLAANGATTPVTFPATPGGSSVLTITPAVSAPEPSNAFLLALVLILARVGNFRKRSFCKL